MHRKALNYFLELPDWNPIAPTIELKIPKMYPARVPRRNVNPSWLIRPLQEVSKTITSMKTAIADNERTVLNQYSYRVCSCLSPRSRYALARSISSSPLRSITFATATLRGLGCDLASQASFNIRSKTSGVTMIGCFGCDSMQPPEALSFFENLTLSEVSGDGPRPVPPRLPAWSNPEPASRPAPQGRDEEEVRK